MSKQSQPEEQFNQNVLAAIGRRGFIQTTSLALLASAAACSRREPGINPNATTAEYSSQPEAPFFRADKYSKEEVDELYGRGLRARAESGALKPTGGNANMATADRAITAETRTTSQHMIFYYDRDANMMVNPGNVKTSLTAGKYSLELKILNSHVSQNDFDKVWKDLKSDAQMLLSLTAPSSQSTTADEVMWTLMNGIDIFLGGDLKGLDKRLRPFIDKNQPTSRFRPSEKIEIPKGGGFFQLQLAAQKKESWWKKLLTVFGAALDSPLFATLPIPKLFPAAVAFTTTVLNQIKKTEPLVPVWESAGIPFVLYDGATPSSDFKFRPGRWVTIDRVYAESRLDERSNLKDHVIDVLGQFNEVKTKDGKPVDANYAVLDLDFPPVSGG